MTVIDLTLGRISNARSVRCGPMVGLTGGGFPHHLIRHLAEHQSKTSRVEA